MLTLKLGSRTHTRTAKITDRLKPWDEFSHSSQLSVYLKALGMLAGGQAGGHNLGPIWVQ